MFHVKRTLIFITMVAALIGCSAIHPTIPVTDYIIEPNGKEIGNSKKLCAFIFENDRSKPAFEQYLTVKLKSGTMSQEFPVTIEGDKFKLIIYDFSEFEKYFGAANYAITKDINKNEELRDQRPFIAISVINAYNEDCLTEQSLFRNIVVKYLQNLKSQFYKL